MKADWMLTNPCEGCKVFEHPGIHRCCEKGRRAVHKIEAQKKLLEWLIAHPSTLSDMEPFVYMDKLELMLMELKEATK